MDGSTAVLIDAGPDILDQLARERVTCLDLVLLTHGHADAMGGLRELGAWVERRNPGHAVPVVTDAKTKRRIEHRWLRLGGLRLVAVKPFATVAIGRMRIRTFPVSHSMTPGFPTFGFSFGKKLAYASDVSKIPKASRTIMQGTRTLVLDGAMYFGAAIGSHLSAYRAIALSRGLRAKRLILTQIGHSYPPHHEAAREIARRDPRTTLAHDGLRIQLP
jgi:phosphoribosyl 1,2-cyclic phosphate phosphodiesterase